MIEIRSVDFDLETIIRVSCFNFEDYFKDKVHVVKINNSKKLMEFSKLLSQISSPKFEYKPDVRAKILIYYADHSNPDTLCLSLISGQYNNRYILPNKRLIKFIEKNR
jgi:hypothetical protein